MSDSKNKYDKLLLAIGILSILVALFSLGVSFYEGTSISTIVPLMFVNSAIMFMLRKNSSNKDNKENQNLEQEKKL